jgi:ABC-2 type transport system permease protein
MFAFIPDELLAAYGFSEGLGHYGLAILFMVTKAFTIMSLAFMFSCFNMKPAAATILTLSLTIMDYVLMKIPAFVDIQHWFLSYYTNAWELVLGTPIPWWRVGESVCVMAGISMTFLVIGVTAFQMRDIKS